MFSNSWAEIKGVVDLDLMPNPILIANGLDTLFTTFSISFKDNRASANKRSDPTLSNAFRRLITSSIPSVAKESVRDMITKLGSSRASTAERIFWVASSLVITFLPFIWPHLLGHT